jgi:GT2 family glycosyltransferase/glycosyltransferase involved in cell wall biosynthesis
MVQKDAFAAAKLDERSSYRSSLLVHKTMPDNGRSSQLLGHIDSARCISLPDGRWCIRLEGWLTHADSEFVVLQAGIPDEPIVMLSTVPRPDLHRAFPLLRPGSKLGFVGNLSCSTPRIGSMPITFLALLPNGSTTAFTIETMVSLEARAPETRKQVRDTATPSASSAVLSNRTRVLFITDSLDLQSRKDLRCLPILRELLASGALVTCLETERLSSMDRDTGENAALEGVTSLAPKRVDELRSLLQQHIPLHDFIWVTQPGGLRLVAAVAPHTPGKIIFSPNVTITDDLFASTPHLSVERRGMASEASRSHQPLVVLDDLIGAVYTLPWFVTLANMADLVVVPNDYTAGLLRTAGIERIRDQGSKIPDLLQEAFRSTRIRTNSAIQKLPALLGEGTHAPSMPTVTEPGDTTIGVDIIVPIHNAAADLQNCLDALSRHTDLPSHLILVDDHSNHPRIDEILSSLPHRLCGSSIQSLTIIRLSRNAGFSGAANIGIAAGNNPYVVLLNSDTVPPPGWLSRLVCPLVTDSSIGSVTPLSNSATICSFSALCGDEKSFDPNGLLKVDALFAQHGAREPITIPTGVGFCLASRRGVYDKIGLLDADLFRKMYAEENDWCSRAILAGLKNVVVTNLFVPHVNGASAKDSNVDRQDLLERNLAKLRLLYPDYDQSIQLFLSNDPLEPLRNIMQLRLIREKKRSSTTLYVHNPELGGGSSRYLEHLLMQRNGEGESLVLAATSEGIFLQESLADTSGRLRISDYLHDDARFRDLLSLLGIREIVVNQLVGSAYDVLTERIRKSKVPYTVHLHDFFYACPTITLIGHTGRYCGAETRASHCSACLNRYFGEKAAGSNLSITAWREHSSEFLVGASALVTASEHTKKLYQRYFPDLQIHVEEPVVDSPTPIRVLHDSSISLPILNVAVLGAIGKHKGSDLIYEIVEILRNRALPIKLIVCGSTDRHSAPYIDQGGFFEVTGRYELSDLPELLARHRISFTLLPSIWPESFLYTASESIACGYPVMVSGITAAAERVLDRDAGWVLQDLTPTAIIAQLEHLFYNRHEIAAKAKNILFAETVTSNPNAPVVLAAQHPFRDFLVEL